MKVKLKKLINILIIISLFLSLFMSNYFYKIPSITKDIVMLLLILLVTILERKKIKLKIIIAVFGLLAFISYYKKVPDIFGVRYYLYPLFIFYYTINYLNKKSLILLKKYIRIYYWLICLVLLIQLGSNYEKLIILFKNFSLEQLKIFRLYSFFSLPTIAGAVLVILGSYIFLEKKSLFYYINTSIFLLLTFSRGSILSYFIFSIFYILFFYKKIRYIFFVFSLILAINIFPKILEFLEKDISFLERILIIKKLYFKNIIVGNGIGYSTGRNIMSKIIFDNEYIRFLYEIGIAGITMFVVIFFKLWKKSRERFKLICLIYFGLMLTMEVITIYPISIFLSLILGIIFIEERNEKDIIYNRQS